jgi:integrase/recombinase XerD
MNIPHRLSTLIEQRLQWMREHHYASKTVQSHQESLIVFNHWCQRHELNRCNEITETILFAYQRTLTQQKTRQQQPLSIGYQRTLLNGIKQCFTWAYERGYLLINPARRIQLPRAHKTLPKVLNLEQLQALLLQPNLNKRHGIRDRALLEVFYATALRRGEVLNLEPNDLDRQQGLVWVKCGKGNKPRKVPIASSALEWVAYYETEVREPWLHKGEHKNKLFINERGKPLSVYSCNENVSKYIRQVIPNKKGSCHLIRHSVATLLLENGCHIRFIQELLGHADLSSTQLYAQVRLPHLREAYQQFHPSNHKNVTK